VKEKFYRGRRDEKRVPSFVEWRENKREQVQSWALFC
jgi:hypothetical protein